MTLFRGRGYKWQAETDGGVMVWKGRGPQAWWDPNDVGLSCVGAYRAINTVGSPWRGGPTAYPESLVNNVTPGVNDLVEGNGAVPWAAATGWGFVAAAAQYFDTGLIPANDQSWSMLVQYANAALGTQVLAGMFSGAARLFQLVPNRAAGTVIYSNGGTQSPAPTLPTGNLGVSGNRGYRNGIADGPALAAWGGASTHAVYIGARNSTGVAALFITADIYAVAIYNANAAAVQGQAAAIAAAMAAL